MAISEFIFKLRTEEEIRAEAEAAASGKPTMFFYVKPDFYGNPGLPSDEQTIFVYTHYPVYSANPVQILDWLYAQSYFNEQE